MALQRDAALHPARTRVLPRQRRLGRAAQPHLRPGQCPAAACDNSVTFPRQDKSWSPSLAACHLHYCYDPPATSPDLFLTQVTAYNASDPPAHGETVRYTCNADPIAADVVHYNYINTTFGYSYVDLECGWNDSWSPATLPMCLSSKKSDCYVPDSDR